MRVKLAVLALGCLIALSLPAAAVPAASTTTAAASTTTAAAPGDSYVDVPAIVKLANTGNPFAQYELGALLLQGQGVKQDRQKAEIWFRRSAQQGNIQSASVLARLLAGKQGHATDAYFWLIIVANTGDKEAVALRDKVAADLPPEEAAVIKKHAFSWRPVLEKPDDKTKK